MKISEKELRLGSLFTFLNFFINPVHPASFQDYEVLDLLGKGGFAKVYRARCILSNNYVAIKMVIIGAERSFSWASL